MTLKEFWESKEKLAINCKSRRQSNIFCEESHKLGKKWKEGQSYLEENQWQDYLEDTCYDNENQYTERRWYLQQDYRVLDFEDIEWNTDNEKHTCPVCDVLSEIADILKPKYQFRVVESRRSVSLYNYDDLLKRVYCHKEDKFDWKIGLGIALQRSIYKDDKDVLYLSKILDYKQMALYCLNKACGYDLSKLEQKVANRKKEDKLIKL